MFSDFALFLKEEFDKIKTKITKDYSVDKSMF